VGQKRFSLEGGESFIAQMDEILDAAGVAGVKEIVIGMAHRGRLNVLVNTLGKMPADLFAEFDHTAPEELPSGDVKYHQGFSSDISTAGGPVHLSLAFNPSHLEIVNPVVEGSVRARMDRRGDTTYYNPKPKEKYDDDMICIRYTVFVVQLVAIVSTTMAPPRPTLLHCLRSRSSYSQSYQITQIG
jgi:2-oxoglutarate dehydrogenase complex dehydrogenase (E1) component-like enzyme